jgi:hypothetical protein
VGNSNKGIDAYQSKRVKGTRTFMCAVDGSEGSLKAFHTMMALRNGLDHVCLLHLYCLEENSSLPLQFQKDEIMAHYESEFLRRYHLPTTKFSFDWENRKERSVIQVLTHILEEFQGKIRNPMTPTRQPPDFFVLGYVGRRRSSTLDEELLLSKSNIDTSPALGNTAYFAYKNIHLPIIITKKTCPDNERCYVIFADANLLENQGFKIILSLVHMHDKVRCVAITSSSSSLHHDPASNSNLSMMGNNNMDMKEKENISIEKIKRIYEDDFSSLNHDDCTFDVLVASEFQSKAELLCDYVNAHNADFFCMTPNDEIRDMDMEYLVNSINCSIILTNNSGNNNY